MWHKVRRRIKSQSNGLGMDSNIGLLSPDPGLYIHSLPEVLPQEEGGTGLELLTAHGTAQKCEE